MSAEQDLWNALTKAGYSSVQAAGIMGNAKSESGFSPEAQAVDSNGKVSSGFLQWNAGSYPDAPGLVTGNAAADLQRQISYLASHHGPSKALSGSTPEEVAGNFAQYFEICQGCQPGGSSYNQRVAQARQVYQDAMSGNWQTGGSGVSGGSSGGSGSGGSANAQNAGLLSGIGQDLIQALLGSLGLPNMKDLFERLGLILLGAALLLIGLRMMFPTVINAANPMNIVTGGSKSGGGSSGKTKSTPAKKEQSVGESKAAPGREAAGEVSGETASSAAATESVAVEELSIAAV